MCISIFYAQVTGLWLFLVALAMIVHHNRFKKTVMDTLNNPALMSLTGFIALALGLLIVVSHNVWVPAWPVVVTLFGWILVFQGVMRIFWPESFAKMTKDLLAKSGYTIMSWVWLIVGAYLLWAGFMS
jgi:tellurite resistance protein TehA-like permease